MKPHKPDASKFGWVGSSCPGKAQMRKNVQKQFLPLDRERERRTQLFDFVYQRIAKIVLKNGPSSASFSFIFVFSNKHYNFHNK